MNNIFKCALVFIVLSLVNGVTRAETVEELSAVIVGSDQASVVDIESYWTDTRMQNATVMELPILSEKEFESLRKILAELDAKELQQILIAPAQPEYTGLNSPSLTDKGAHQESVKSYKTSKVPKSRFNDSKSPYYRIGKVFFTIAGKDYVCSGASIANRALLLAGHCVYDPDKKKWATKISFCPSYNNGCYFNWKWWGKKLYSLKGWVNNKNYAYDLAMVVTTAKLSHYVGTLGWHSSGFTFSNWIGVGYPAKPIPGYKFDGRYMWQSAGKKLNSGLQGINAMENNMTGGSSGGPWLDPTKWNNIPFFYANSINSFGYDSRPGVMYSPAFGQGFINLYNAVKNQ